VRWLGLALIAFTHFGCGPIQSTQVLVDADAELRAANRVNARQKAPYEVELATKYLRQAKEAKAHAEYQVAVRYGKRALACAQAALLTAQPGEPASRRAEGVTCGPPYAVPDRPAGSEGGGPSDGPPGTATSTPSASGPGGQP